MHRREGRPSAPRPAWGTRRRSVEGEVGHLVPAAMGRTEREPKILVAQGLHVIGLPVGLDARPALAAKDERTLGALSWARRRHTLPAGRTVERLSRAMGGAQRRPERFVGHHVRVVGLPVRVDPLPAGASEGVTALRAARSPSLGRSSITGAASGRSRHCSLTRCGASTISPPPAAALRYSPARTRRTGPTRPAGIGGNHHVQRFATGFVVIERSWFAMVVVTSTSRTFVPFWIAPVVS
jgi:hypothetical protein